MTNRPDWDDIWLDHAETISARSWCARRKVGAVIVTTENESLAQSYNGPPAGLPVEGPCVAWCKRAQNVLEMPEEGMLRAGYGTCPSIHAEANALLRADRYRIKGGALFVTSAVCWDCAKLVANSGLSRVVQRVSWHDDAHRDPQRSIDFMRRCGLHVVSRVTRDKKGSD